MHRRQALKIGGAGLLGSLTGCVGSIGGGSEEFPSQDITCLHPYGGGSSSAAATLLLQDRNENEDIFPVDIRGQERTGGGGIVGYNTIWNADPDGYTICDSVNPAMLLKPFVLDAPEYDPKEFTYLPCGVEDFDCGAVQPDSDIESGDDYIEALRDGAQFAAVSETSSLTVQLMALGGVSGLFDPAIVLDQWVQYPIGETASAVVKGEVELGGLNLASVIDFVERGDLKIPLYFHEEDDLPDRALEIAPEADTLDDLDISQSEISDIKKMFPNELFFGWLAPPDLPEERRQTLDDGFQQAMDSSVWENEIRDRNLGFPTFVSGEDTEASVIETIEMWEERDDLVALWN